MARFSISFLYFVPLLLIWPTTVMPIGEFEDRAGIVLGHTVRDVQGVGQGILHTTLRSNSDEGQGEGNVLTD